VPVTIVALWVVALTQFVLAVLLMRLARTIEAWRVEMDLIRARPRAREDRT